MDRIFSKIILSGEHSVLRGGYAVVAPNKNYSLEYSFKEAEFSLKLSEEIAHYELLFLGLIESALANSGATKKELNVFAKVKSIVPLGEGLGGSAALCVFVARLFLFAGVLKEEEVFSFAHEIENVFHGQSSGLDIAGCMTDKIILYQKGLKKVIKPKLSGYCFTVHSTNERGDTKDCVEKVLKLRKKNKDLFHSLDDKMSKASLMCKESLESESIEKLVQSFQDTYAIFKEWGLLTKATARLAQSLTKEGALAVRLSGSGMGGCLVALWKGSRKKTFLRL